MKSKTIHISYYAMLREQRGLTKETITTTMTTPAELYEQLREQHSFTLNPENIHVAVNDTFADWHTALHDDDTIIFLPPYSGG